MKRKIRSISDRHSYRLKWLVQVVVIFQSGDHYRQEKQTTLFISNFKMSNLLIENKNTTIEYSFSSMVFRSSSRPESGQKPSRTLISATILIAGQFNLKIWSRKRNFLFDRTCLISIWLFGWYLITCSKWNVSTSNLLKCFNTKVFSPFAMVNTWIVSFWK